ncbi:MAG: HAD-IIIA family hydrolase [Alphaproteobacteria bacterium]|nr:HAD-IIIA family hydrolase [Alphaproteobacteria bacterium]
MARLVMLDRDGVLNVDRPRSVRHPDELEMIPGAAQAVARLNRAGLRVALVSNQAVVGRGEIDRAMLDAIQARLRDALGAAGARLDAEFLCTDTEGPRRKPAPGMLLEALARFGADPAATPMIGDALTDLQAAKQAGCARVLVLTGKETLAARDLPADLAPVAIHPDLARAVDALLGVSAR